MPLLLDTDIGSDVDDALALAVVAGSPELTLDGILTVYGQTDVRARIARRYLRLAGVPDTVPVTAGAQRPRSGGDVWWAGHEGAAFDDLDAQPISDEGLDLLARAMTATPGQIDVLAIGPLTNIADALDAGPGFARGVGRLVVMGADFRPDRTVEHNIACDIAAAQRVFASELDIVVGGLDLTRKVELRPAGLAQIADAGPLGEYLARDIRTWWDFTGREASTPHDAVVALWLAQPDLFTTIACDVSVDAQGKTWAQPSSTGRVRVLDTAEPERVRDQIVTRIARAAGRAA